MPVEASASIYIMAEPRSPVTATREKEFHLTKRSFLSAWPLAYFTSMTGRQELKPASAAMPAETASAT